MDTAMDTVIIDPAPSVLAERERLGLDQQDEVWDGVAHMVPPASYEHMRIELELVMALHPIVVRSSLLIGFELGLFDPAAAGNGNFRTPDLIVSPPELAVARGIEGPASMVMEIRSPGDESFLKLPFYEQLGVGEVLIIDGDTKTVRRWVLIDGHLVESPGDPTGFHQLACIPVSLHTDHGALVVTTDDGTTRI